MNEIITDIVAGTPVNQTPARPDKAKEIIFGAVQDERFSDDPLGN
jgi:hypothetical protein